MLLKILLTLFFSFGIFSGQQTFAQEEEILFFWGTTCPFCHVVMDEIEERGLEDELDIVMLEIYEEKDNLDLFREKVGVCGINPNQAGVPLLFTEGECFIGPDAILSKLLRLAGEEEVEDIEIIENEEQVDPVEIPEDEGRRNTVYLILGIFSILALLLIVGYAIEGKKKNMVTILLLVSSGALFASPANAICPVCTVAVGAGLGFSRYFGIDDVITGIWIGGLITSMILWFVGWLDKKEIETKKMILFKFLLIISFVSLVIYTLYALSIVGDPLNILWGVDKILLGMTFGAISFLTAAKLHFYVKDSRDGKVLVPFQKVIFTILGMLLVTLIFYVIIY
jgi:hypothetical protein